MARTTINTGPTIYADVTVSPRDADGKFSVTCTLTLGTTSAAYYAFHIWGFINGKEPDGVWIDSQKYNAYPHGHASCGPGPYVCHNGQFICHDQAADQNIAGYWHNSPITKTWSGLTSGNSITWDIGGSGSFTTVTFDEPPNPAKTNLYIKKQNIDGTYAAREFWKTVSGSYDAQTWTDGGDVWENATFSGASPSDGSNQDREANADRKLYYFDVNGWIDDTSQGGLVKDNITYGTCSISSNDGLGGATNVTDYYTKHRYGATVTVKDIKQKIGRTYKGVRENGSNIAKSITESISKTIGTGTTEVRLWYRTNDMRVNSGGWKPGDTYIKIGNEWKRVPHVYIKQSNGAWKLLDG